MNSDVVELRGREVEHQRLPRVAVVERDVDSALAAREQQTAPLWVRSNDTHERSARQRRRQTGHDLRPRSPIIAGAVDVRAIITARVEVECGVGCAPVEAGGFDRGANWAGSGSGG